MRLYHGDFGEVQSPKHTKALNTQSLQITVGATVKPDLYWIPGPWPGRLAIATRPRGGDWLENEIGALRQARVDFIVSLLEASEVDQFELEQERELAVSESVGFISFPIPDRGVPVSLPDALSLFNRLATALNQGKNVAVHCHQGVGRSGLVTASLLVASGIAVEKAIEIVSAARGQSVPETPVQLEWLKHLPSELLVMAS